MHAWAISYCTSTSPSGQSGDRPHLGQALSRLNEIQITTQKRRAEAGGCRLFLVRAACHGPRFPRKSRDAFPASFGLGHPAQSDAGEAPPKQPVSCASLPKNQRLRLRPPKPPCIPYLEPPAISIEQFRRMRHFFSIAEDKPWPIQDIFLVMFSLLSRLMSRIDPPVPQQLDPRGNLLPNSGRKLLAAPHLLDKAPVRTPVRTPQILIDRCL